MKIGRNTLGRLPAAFLAAGILVSFPTCGKIETTTIPFDSVVDQNDQSLVIDSSRHVVWGALSKSGSASYLPGVAVSGPDSSTATDANGTYKIYLPAGPQKLQYTLEGFLAETKEVSGPGGAATELNVALTPVGSTGTGGGGTGGGGGGTGGGSGGDGFVVTPGARVERRLRVPCFVEYSITGKLPSVEDGSSRDGVHMAWAYEKDWGGGNTTAGGGMIVGVRDYAMKAYHADGSYAGQQRFSIGWNPSRTYRVRLAIDGGQSTFFVDGSPVVSMKVDASGEATVGYGWPPSGRPGPEGAVITDVSWSE